MKMNFGIKTATILALLASSSAAFAGPNNGQPWKSRCKDGYLSQSYTSLGLAICGCVGHGGSIDYPKFDCSKRGGGKDALTSNPVKVNPK